jgi:hypothetical protein
MRFSCLFAELLMHIDVEPCTCRCWLCKHNSLALMCCGRPCILMFTFVAVTSTQLHQCSVYYTASCCSRACLPYRIDPFFVAMRQASEARQAVNMGKIRGAKKRAAKQQVRRSGRHRP